jgi:hypothetical protein
VASCYYIRQQADTMRSWQACDGTRLRDFIQPSLVPLSSVVPFGGRGGWTHVALAPRTPTKLWFPTCS